MTTFYVLLASIDDVKLFVDAATRCPCEVDVRSDRYLVNGKSIMGLFSLDLSKPVAVEVHGEDADAGAFQNQVSSMIVPAP